MAQPPHPAYDGKTARSLAPSRARSELGPMMHPALAHQGHRAIRRTARAAVAEHAALLAVLAVGAVLRLAVLVTYPSGLFFSDSWAYLDTAWRNFPVGIAPDRPVGYPLFLHLFGWGHNLGLVFGLQQLAGLGLAAGACFLLVRLGVRKAIAVAVAALICLDGYAIALAQSVMAEPVAVVLTFASFALLVLSDRRRDLAFSGLLLAASVCVR